MEAEVDNPRSLSASLSVAAHVRVKQEVGILAHSRTQNIHHLRSHQQRSQVVQDSYSYFHFVDADGELEEEAHAQVEGGH